MTVVENFVKGRAQLLLFKTFAVLPKLWLEVRQLYSMRDKFWTGRWEIFYLYIAPFRMLSENVDCNYQMTFIYIYKHTAGRWKIVLYITPFRMLSENVDCNNQMTFMYINIQYFKLLCTHPYIYSQYTQVNSFSPISSQMKCQATHLWHKRSPKNFNLNDRQQPFAFHDPNTPYRVRSRQRP